MRWLHGEGVAVLGYASRHGGDDAKGNSASHRGRSGPPVVGRVDRRWYWCALVGGIAGRSVGGALVGGAIGAVAGALIADATRPRTCVSHGIRPPALLSLLITRPFATLPEGMVW